MLFVLAHTGSVRGVAIDALNQVLASAGSDGCVKFCKFRSGELLSSLKMTSFVAALRLHRDRCALILLIVVLFFYDVIDSLQWNVGSDARRFSYCCY